MPTIINEEKLVNENVLLYENRFNTKLVRFIDHTQTYVTYFHIDTMDSTVDDGFIDIESLVGARSPFRYHKIKKFPLYGLDAIIPQLQDNEWGLDSSFEGDLIILPGTIKPLENDFFIIDYLELPVVFRVTEISYDNIRPDNYYQIHYRVEFIGVERVHQLENKVLEEYDCVMENIGTEERCIIKSTDHEIIKKIRSMYVDMVTTYLDMYYDEKHNSVLSYADDGSGYVYDQYLTYFINSHNLLENPNSIRTYILSTQIEDPRFEVKYERSIYRIFERQDVTLLNPIWYNYIPGKSINGTTFMFYYEKNIHCVDFVPEFRSVNLTGMKRLLSDELIERFVKKEFGISPHMDLMIHYLNKDEIPLESIDLNMHRELLILDRNEEIYFFTPIILYILREVVK